jgi:hypothetical protein
LDLTAAARDRLGRWRDGRIHGLATALAELPADQRATLDGAVPALAVLTRTIDHEEASRD